MPIEPLQVQTYNNTASFNGGNKVNKQQPSLIDNILTKKQDDKNVLQKDEDNKERDFLELSTQAQQLLDTQKIIDNRKAGSQLTQESLEQNAIEFRGYSILAQRRELTETEVGRVRDIRAQFEELGKDDKDILELAEEKLFELQALTPELVSLLNEGNINGSQFKELNQINSLLNKSNGFGSDQVEKALQVRIDGITKKFNEILDLSPEQKLSKDTLSNLEKLQEELSQIQGYKLNVKDSIGTEGIVL